MHYRYMDPCSKSSLGTDIQSNSHCFIHNGQGTSRFLGSQIHRSLLRIFPPLQNYLLVDITLKQTSYECGSRVTLTRQMSVTCQHYATTVSRVIKGIQSHESNKKMLPSYENYLLVDNTLKRIYSKCGSRVTPRRQVSMAGQHYVTTSYLKVFLKTQVKSPSHKVSKLNPSLLNVVKPSLSLDVWLSIFPLITKDL